MLVGPPLTTGKTDHLMRWMTTHPGSAEHVTMSTPYRPSTSTRRNLLLLSREALVDEMLAYYIDWRANAAAVWDTYAAWVNAPTCERPARFSAYAAALEQEESAAMTYAVVVEHVARAAQP
jgi:hypothetical protein